MAFLSFFLIFVFNIFRAESYILNKLRFPIFCGFFLDTCSTLSRFRASTNHGYIFRQGAAWFSCPDKISVTRSDHFRILLQCINIFVFYLRKKVTKKQFFR